MRPFTILRFALPALVLAISLLAAAPPARAFIIRPNDPDPWLSTASGPRAGNGAPATLTWSFVPDGTATTPPFRFRH